MRKWLLVFLLFFIASSGCVSALTTDQSGGDEMRGREVKFGGANGFELTGTLWENTTTQKPALILVHQLGRDRRSFADFGAFAFGNGFTVLSFDMRGHGESRPGNASYVNFTADDWKLIAEDIEAARNYLNAERVLVVGASIGANAALNFGANENTCVGTVLLSPGLDYRGLTALEAAQTTRCPFLIVASEEDRYAAQSSQSLFANANITDKRLLLIQDAGHGTDMLSARATLSQEIVDWLNAHS